MKTLLLAAAALFAATSADACGFIGQPPCMPQPMAPPMPTTIMPFGRGAIVNTPGQMPTTVQPFGQGVIINTPGQMPRTCQPFGAGTICH
jgi:hypothetical protein